MRYLRLYLYFLRFSFSRAFEFRMDFYFRIVMDAIYYAVNLAFFAILYDHTGLLGGWTLDQAYIFVCAFLLSDAIHMTVVSNNLWMLPLLINRGDLDYYILRPVSSLFFLSVREFAANSFVNLLIAAGLLVWSIVRYPGSLDAGALVVFGLFILIGAFLNYLLRLVFLIPIFWLHSGRGLDELFYSIEKFSERPDQIFTGWLRRILVTVVPVAFVASIPARVLFAGLTWETVLHAAAVTAALFLFVIWFWRRGLRAYSSASS